MCITVGVTHGMKNAELWLNPPLRHLAQFHWRSQFHYAVISLFRRKNFIAKGLHFFKM